MGPLKLRLIDATVGPLKPLYLRYEILEAGLRTSRRQGGLVLRLVLVLVLRLILRLILRLFLDPISAYLSISQYISVILSQTAVSVD